MGLEHGAKQLERLTFFSDAVFAIAMTLLVVDLRLPATEYSNNYLLDQALLNLSPHYLGFVVSFLVIGRFWLAHHRIFGLLTRTSEPLLWSNMIVLLAIAFTPFPTAVLSEWGHLRDAVLFYAAWLVALGIAMRILVTVALKRPGLIRDDVSEAECRYLRRGGLVAPVVGVGTLAAGAISGQLGAAVLVFGSPIAYWLLHLNAPRSVPTTDSSPGAAPGS